MSSHANQIRTRNGFDDEERRCRTSCFSCELIKGFRLSFYRINFHEANRGGLFYKLAIEQVQGEQIKNSLRFGLMEIKCEDGHKTNSAKKRIL